MAGNLDLFLEAARLSSSTAASAEDHSSAAVSLTDCDTSDHDNSDDQEFDREDISSEEGSSIESVSRKRLTSREGVMDEATSKRSKAMESHNENERKRRRGLKSSVLRLREQLTQKTRKPSQISILQAAQDEIQELKRKEAEEEKTLNELRKRNDYLTFYIQKQREKAANFKALSCNTISAPIDHTGGNANDLATCEKQHCQATRESGETTEQDAATQSSHDAGSSHSTYWPLSPPVLASPSVAYSPLSVPFISFFPHSISHSTTMVAPTSTAYPHTLYPSLSPYIARQFTPILPSQYVVPVGCLPTSTVPHSVFQSAKDIPQPQCCDGKDSRKSSVVQTVPCTMQSAENSIPEPCVDIETKTCSTLSVGYDHMGGQRHVIYPPTTDFTTLFQRKIQNYSKNQPKILPKSTITQPLSPSFCVPSSELQRLNACCTSPNLNDISRLPSTHKNGHTMTNNQLSPTAWNSTLTAASGK